MKKVRVAIIGQGRSGRDIHGAHFISDKRKYQIVAAVDLLKDRRERSTAEYGCDVYRNYKDLFKRDDLDLIVNATPSHLHVPITLDVLQAGYNCLCDKPMANNPKDVDKLIKAAKKSKVLYAIYQQSRFAPYFEKVKEVIASGVLGRIAQISIAFNGFSRRYDWQTLQKFMGGNLLNTGPHPLDQALQLFGTDIMPEVSCYMDSVNNTGDAEDHVVLMLRGNGRPMIHLEVSSCCAYPCFTYHVYGQHGGMKGSMTEMEWKYIDPKENPRPKLVRKPLVNAENLPVYPSEKLKWKMGRWKISKAQANIFEYMSKRFYDMLHKTLTEGAPLTVTPQEIRQQAAVIQACQKQNPQIYGKKDAGVKSSRRPR